LTPPGRSGSAATQNSIYRSRRVRLDRTGWMHMDGIIVDTNIFVAAGFNPKSASARLIKAIREGRYRLVWNQPTRRETEMILRRIPRLDWGDVVDLFQPEGEFKGGTTPEAFACIVDPDDRKFTALSAATGCPLISNDDHVLAQRDTFGIQVVTPGVFMARQGG
jgi:uncharacterized protein